MSFYENYVRMCNKIGKTPSAVALEIGLSKPAVHRWKNGGAPTDATARRVADYFGVSISDLKGSLLTLEDVVWTVAKENGMNGAAKLLETEKPADPKIDGLRGTGYYDLTPENRAMIDSLIDSLLKSQSGE